MSIPSPVSTLSAIRRKVRHLTNSPNENSLPDSEIDEVINDIYQTDFAYGVKTDQMRSVYAIYTEPFRDRYPLDVNFNQGIRAPAYFDGIQGGFYKDRVQFYNLWPKITTQYQPINGNGVDTVFTFTIAAPFLSHEVVLGGIAVGGSPISVTDDGNGLLYLVTPNPQTSSPPFSTNPAIPVMYNKNLGNPGLYNPLAVGTVDYVTGQFSIDFSLAGVIPADGQQMTLRVAQYNTGKPYSILFWNNEFIIRPVPQKIHKIEVETYLTPVQFLEQTDNPIINQWWKFIAYLVACEIQRDRNDFDSVAQLQEGAKRQEALVLERQGVEEIGQPNFTLFNSTLPNPYLSNFWGQGL